MSEFKAILVEGIFVRNEGEICVQETSEIPSLVTGKLEPLLGQEVQLAVVHLPRLPLEPGKWAGGCCLWQPSPCPVGHHINPAYLLNFTATGVLHHEGRRWWVTGFDGKEQMLPLEQLEGHHGRIAAATVFHVEKAREALADVDLEDIGALGVKAEELRETLANLANWGKK